MKKLSLITLAGLFLVSSETAADEGERIFNSQGCAHCHKPATSKIGPSLKEMVQAYQEKKDRLMLYLKGEAEPIMDKRHVFMMKRPLEKTKSLSEEDRKSLAQFVMSHKD